ncbi:MAG TPA: alkaline phosphatase family protein [Terriglobales bacterium]|nr:alkaline phosphatase family protein [Terriglobales bacterium]
MSKRLRFMGLALLAVCVLGAWLVADTGAQASKAKPKVMVIGVNGAEWDFLRPLLVRGELPNLARLIENGTSGYLKTLSSPNCPKVYTTFFTSTPPVENGVTGFVVNGQTANTHMLKQEPIWSILSKNGVSVGMANVPGTFPVMPVNGYMVSGMLTRGKDCEDGVLCSPKLTEVQGGDPVYPAALKDELLANVGDFYIDCARIPKNEALAGHEAEAINQWLAKVDTIRAQQTKLFDYLLTKYPKDFTFLVQSCEDRTGHWLYPIQPHNVGYNAKIHQARVDAFPNQYRAFDKVLGSILKHVDENTYVFIVSDHGIKPLRYSDHHEHMDHPMDSVIAKHDFNDGDEVPGAFIAVGPGIKKGFQLQGLPVSAFDIAPTLLHLYGIPQPKQMKGRVLTEIFEDGTKVAEAAAKTEHAH